MAEIIFVAVLARILVLVTRVRKEREREREWASDVEIPYRSYVPISKRHLPNLSAHT